jgi:hypothetical protein
MSQKTDLPENSPSEIPPVSPAPENSTQPGPKNEPITRTANQPKSGLLEKARGAAARVLSEAGFQFHKGRGRPKNCPACKNRLPEKSACTTCAGTGHVPGKSDGAIAGVPPVAAADGLPADSPIRIPITGLAAGGDRAGDDTSVSALFRRSVKSSVKGVLGILKTIVAVYANAAGCRPEFTREQLAKVEPDAEALADFTESLDVVLKKHDVKPEHAEEWSLAINTGRLLVPYGMLIAEFRGEMARNRVSNHAEREREKLELRRSVENEFWQKLSNPDSPEMARLRELLVRGEKGIA